MVINNLGAPTPAPTPFPPTPAPSMKNSIQHIINPKPQPFTVITPRKHVIATALRQPLQLSTNRIEMFAPSSFYDPSIQSGQMQSKVSCHTHISCLMRKPCLSTFATKLDSDQPAQVQKLTSLGISGIETVGIIWSRLQITKTVIRLLMHAYRFQNLQNWSKNITRKNKTAAISVAIPV